MSVMAMIAIGLPALGQNELKEITPPEPSAKMSFSNGDSTCKVSVTKDGSLRVDAINLHYLNGTHLLEATFIQNDADQRVRLDRKLLLIFPAEHYKGSRSYTSETVIGISNEYGYEVFATDCAAAANRDLPPKVKALFHHHYGVR